MPTTSAIKLPLTASLFLVKQQLGITVVPDRYKPRAMTGQYWKSTSAQPILAGGEDQF